MSNLKVTHKLLLAFAILVAAVAMAGAMVGASLSSIQRITELNQHSYAYIDTLGDTSNALVEQQNATRGFVASLDPSFLEKYAKHAAEYDDAFKALETGAEGPEEKARADALAAAVLVFRDETSRQIAAAGDPLTLDQARADIGTSGRLTNIRKILKAIAADEGQQLAARSAEQSKAFRAATQTLVIGRDPVAADPARARSQYVGAWGDAETQAYYAALKTRLKVSVNDKLVGQVQRPEPAESR